MPDPAETVTLGRVTMKEVAMFIALAAAVAPETRIAPVDAPVMLRAPWEVEFQTVPAPVSSRVPVPNATTRVVVVEVLKSPAFIV